ncbi:hypothetical protein AC481_05965 [miscellaneous Crenarchaeota group archaeon SMTZ-80]|nr:MAG: hypothetical protein AC481_05965 [miscellaneous Crenarchaeota group archaeon SMTZ-80]
MYRKILNLIEELKSLFQKLPELVNEKGEEKVFKDINILLNEMSRLRNHLNKEEEGSAKAIFQKDVSSIGVESMFYKHVVDKPFGYAGDFMAMEMIYKAHSDDDAYLGTTERGKLINAYAMQIANCKANYHRIYFLLGKINDCTFNNISPKICSIGCASCLEVREFLKQNNISNDFKFTLVDIENEAIAFSKNLLPQDGNFTFYQENLIKAALRDKFKDLLEEQDLIYSFGFYDYISLRTAKLLTGSLWKCVKSGASLLFINAHPSNPSRLLMEFGGDWYLNYKTKGEIYSIVEDLNNLKEIKYHLDDFGVYQYIECFKI